MTFTVVPVRRAEELDGALAAMMLKRPEGLMVTGDPLHQLHVGRIINFLADNRLPGLFQYRENVVAGGLMSYGASLPDLFRRAAGYVDKILRGTRPADLPVEQPTKFELVVNLKTAKALGLTVPEPFLLLADVGCSTEPTPFQVICSARTPSGRRDSFRRQNKSLSGARFRPELDCLGVAAAAGQGKPWIAFAGQKFTGSRFDERSDYFQQGLLLRTTSSREEVAQVDLGDLSARGDVRLMQHEHFARFIFAQTFGLL